jgi:hypothetical protein
MDYVKIAEEVFEEFVNQQPVLAKTTVMFKDRSIQRLAHQLQEIQEATCVEKSANSIAFYWTLNEGLSVKRE